MSKCESQGRIAELEIKISFRELRAFIMMWWFIWFIIMIIIAIKLLLSLNWLVL